MKMKRSQRLGIYLGKILLIFMCAIFLINIVWPDKKQSDQENRSLQTFPSLSLTDLSSGTFNQNLDAWFSDQFVGRQMFIHMKYWTQKLTGNKKIESVFLGKNGLIEDINEPNTEQLERNKKAINKFYQDRNLQTTFLLAPTAANIWQDQLPRGAYTLDQNEQIDDFYKSISSGIEKVDIRPILEEHKDEYLYYHTDHHWTTLGAYYAFSQLNEVMEYGDVNLDSYTIYPVTTSFKGTLSKQTGSTNIKDQIDIYVPKSKVEYIMTDQSTGEKSPTLYVSDALNTSDAYTVFMGGNHGLLKIETTADSDKHLLLIKDSYANALIPFLIPYYRTITVVDPRYYFDDVQLRIDMDMINEVMYVYNANTFMIDTSLADMLNGASDPISETEE